MFRLFETPDISLLTEPSRNPRLTRFGLSEASRLVPKVNDGERKPIPEGRRQFGAFRVNLPNAAMRSPDP